MNEDLMNRILSQVRIGLVLQRDQDLRECLPSDRNFDSKVDSSRARDQGQRND